MALSDAAVRQAKPTGKQMRSPWAPTRKSVCVKRVPVEIRRTSC